MASPIHHQVVREIIKTLREGVKLEVQYYCKEEPDATKTQTGHLRKTDGETPALEIKRGVLVPFFAENVEYVALTQLEDKRASTPARSPNAVEGPRSPAQGATIGSNTEGNQGSNTQVQGNRPPNHADPRRSPARDANAGVPNRVGTSPPRQRQRREDAPGRTGDIDDDVDRLLRGFADAEQDLLEDGRDRGRRDNLDVARLLAGINRGDDLVMLRSDPASVFAAKLKSYGRATALLQGGTIQVAYINGTHAAVLSAYTSRELNLAIGDEVSVKVLVRYVLMLGSPSTQPAGAISVDVFAPLTWYDYLRSNGSIEGILRQLLYRFGAKNPLAGTLAEAGLPTLLHTEMHNLIEVLKQLPNRLLSGETVPAMRAMIQAYERTLGEVFILAGAERTALPGAFLAKPSYADLSLLVTKPKIGLSSLRDIVCDLQRAPIRRQWQQPRQGYQVPQGVRDDLRVPPPPTSGAYGVQYQHDQPASGSHDERSGSYGRGRVFSGAGSYGRGSGYNQGPRSFRGRR